MAPSARLLAPGTPSIKRSIADLAAKCILVARPAEHELVDPVQLGEAEGLGEEARREIGTGALSTQARQRRLDDRIMVER